jgi:hypothetical protein
VDVRTLTSSNLENGILTLTFTDKGAVTTIEAGKPYIIKWGGNVGGVVGGNGGGSVTNPYNQGSVTNSEDLVNPVFSGVTVSTATAPVQTEYVDFIGITSPLDFTANDLTKLFLGVGNTLYYPNAAMTVNACRAYFALKNGLTAGDPALSRFVLNFGDEESQGITTTDFTDSTDSDGAWYDLNGRKLNGKPTKAGLYINKGHKVMVK